ncbi:hypothetical protein [Solimonas marina]|uniref:Serine/threonine protein phosphatase n=1 Tax=Solimonas marina TaxID=2714601 RepID=A0A969W8G1_9GAMM|nr:hypothetical protein [Solimonas marina]NKF22332.1 hypothetical protein [Solimonas marina]
MYRPPAMIDMPPSGPAAGGSRVFALRLGEGRAWLKLPGRPKWRFWHDLQRLLVMLIPAPMLRPTASRSGGELQHEGERIRRFRALALPAPEVLACGDAYLLTADAGPTLSRFLAACDDRTAQRLAVIRAAEALGRIHAAGEYHGRPFFKDIAYNGARVTFLDFEEDPLRVMSLADAQARDLCLFLLSLAKWRLCSGALRGWFVEALRAYLRCRPPPAMVAALRRNLPVLSRVLAPLRPLPRRWIGRDLTAALSIPAMLLPLLDSPALTALL